MRAKLYEKYYKRGIGYYVFKEYLGLGRPEDGVKGFYYALMLSVLLLGIFVIN